MAIPFGKNKVIQISKAYKMNNTKNLVNQIECSIFSRYEADIIELSTFINGHEVISKKVDKANELLRITDILLNCEKYDAENGDCENCHFVLSLRKEIARMIIEASQMPC